jgi:hypothetical protein
MLSAFAGETLALFSIDHEGFGIISHSLELKAPSANIQAPEKFKAPTSNIAVFRLELGA